MRKMAIAFAATMFCGAASAAKPGLMDQFSGANQSFMGGIVDARQWIETYHTHVLSGLGGKWIALSAIQPGTQADVEKICKQTTDSIRTTSDYSFVLTRLFGKGKTLDYAYDYVIGNTFAEHVDPAKLLDSIGVQSPQLASARLGVLRAANGQVGLFRPSEDILVIQYSRSGIVIYGRCP